ncbi:MAG: hypothetical protein HOH58_06455 [Opitutaceae bacterium]|jgi:hypothetical protein|nr:hypothetical protein [Opitutaceae bacterium]
MELETVIYFTNTIICAIIAVLMTDAWLQSNQRESLRYWMIAAWVMLLADILFAARPLMSDMVGRILPTVLVTLGHAALFVGTRVHAEQPAPKKLGWALVVFHAVALVLFFTLAPESVWRRVTNSLVWASLALLSYQGLRMSPSVYWRPLTAPAKVFLAHAGFHFFRLIVSLVADSSGNSTFAAMVDIIGDLEVSFFMVALFVGLLLAHLEQRNAQLRTALAEVETLTGLLPICAWCKKIRDDDGYWKQVDEYFRQRSQIQFSHGMCSDCSDKFENDEA